MLQRTNDSGVFSRGPTIEISFPTSLNPFKSAPVPKWPDPQKSVGKHCCILGEQNFWEVKDPGREELATLEPEVRELLNTHNENLKEREACNVSFAIFMVGRKETACCPTLIIISSNKTARRKVMDVIRADGILEKYRGVLLAGSSKHPRYPKSAPAEFIAFGLEIDISSSFPSGINVYIRKSITKVTSGTWIYIPIIATTMEVSQFRRATLGGFLDLITEDGARTTVGMTVAHAFHQQDQGSVPNQSEFSEDDDFEFEFDRPTPHSIFCKDSVADPSPQSLTCSPFPFSFLPDGKQIAEVEQTITLAETTSSLQPFGEMQFVSEKGSELTKLGILLKTSLKARPTLDWALIEITAKELTISNIMHYKRKMSTQSILPTRDFSTIKEDTAVATCTGSKLATRGVMSGSSTFLKMMHSDTFEEVKTVNLSGCLSYGDSGSWIVERDSGRLCGHIVAGDVSTGLAYAIPAKSVFEQIESQLSCRLEISESGIVRSEHPRDRKTQLDSPAGTRDELMGKGKGKDTTSTQHSEFLVTIAGIGDSEHGKDFTGGLGSGNTASSSSTRKPPVSSPRLGFNSISQGEFKYDRESTSSASILAAQGRLSSNDFQQEKWAPQDIWSTSPSTLGKRKGVSTYQQETQAPRPNSCLKPVREVLYYTWSCCTCGVVTGTTEIPACIQPDCQHFRCFYCPIEKHEKRIR